MRVESCQKKFHFVVQAAEVVNAVLVARSRMLVGGTQGGCELRVQDHAAPPSLHQIGGTPNRESRIVNRASKKTTGASEILSPVTRDESVVESRISESSSFEKSTTRNPHKRWESATLTRYAWSAIITRKHPRFAHGILHLIRRGIQHSARHRTSAFADDTRHLREVGRLEATLTHFEERQALGRVYLDRSSATTKANADRTDWSGVCRQGECCTLPC